MSNDEIIALLETPGITPGRVKEVLDKMFEIVVIEQVLYFLYNLSFICVREDGSKIVILFGWDNKSQSWLYDLRVN